MGFREHFGHCTKSQKKLFTLESFGLQPRTKQVSFCLYMEFRSWVYYKDKIVILLSSFKKLESILWARIYFTFLCLFVWMYSIVLMKEFLHKDNGNQVFFRDVVSCPGFQEVCLYNNSFQTSQFLRVSQSTIQKS